MDIDVIIILVLGFLSLYLYFVYSIKAIEKDFEWKLAIMEEMYKKEIKYLHDVIKHYQNMNRQKQSKQRKKRK